MKPEIADTPLSELSSALLLADLEDEYQKLLEKREIIKMIILNATNAGLADTPAIISRKEELHTLEERITRCYEKLSLYRSVHG